MIIIERKSSFIVGIYIFKYMTTNAVAVADSACDS
jgi:hypothetical protein